MPERVTPPLHAPSCSRVASVSVTTESPPPARFPGLDCFVRTVTDAGQLVEGRSRRGWTDLLPLSGPDTVSPRNPLTCIGQ